MGRSYKGHTKTFKDGVNPRSITAAERPWIEAWSPETRDLLMQRLAARGCSRTLQMRVANYLAQRASGEPSAVVSKPTRIGYRKLLAGLALAPIMFDTPVAA